MQSIPAKIVPIAPPLSAVGDAGIGSAFSSSSDIGEISLLAGYSVIRRPDQLKLHPTLQKLGWTGLVDELNDAARVKEQALRGPILITKDGTLLAGFGRWRLALLQHKDEISCIEYPLDGENESLQFILAHHQPSRAWNPFIRTCVALTLMPYFQQKALENMRAGGKYKGLAKLPEAEAIDVRLQIAAIAGVGARNVSNVQFILNRAHPRIKDALRDSRLTINRAVQFCKLSYFKQAEEFVRSTEERERKKVIRRAIAGQTTTSPDVLAVLRDLQQRATEHPGSVLVQIGSTPDTVVFTVRDSITGLTTKGAELK
jgi:hypothetical protein